MKALRIMMMVFAGSMLLLTACAKKDSNFAARYERNKMGAKVVDGPKAEQAGNAAAAQGLEADIVAMSGTTADGNINGPYTMTAVLLINNTQQSVQTVHYGTEIQSGETNIGGRRVRYTAMCSQLACEPFYAMMEVYNADGSRAMQVGVRKNFYHPELDVYQWLAPENSLSFLANGPTDPNGMVGFLNSDNTAVITGH